MNKLEEFWYCVASQDDLPLYKGQEISSNSCTNLLNLIELYKSKVGSDNSDAIIKSIILEKPKIISDMRILVGVSDKRLYLDLTYLVNVYTDNKGNRLVSESREHLLKHDTEYFIKQLSASPMKTVLAAQISRYFIEKGITDILNTFASLTTIQIVPIFNNLIATKELQQKQAKYRGHGAEQAFAQIATACGMKITPPNKDTEPMAEPDPNVDLSSMKVVKRNASNEDCHSFDLIITENDDIRILIQSLIHSSDPGQYGVNKSNETVDISKRIAIYNKLNGKSPVYLLGSVDGVGFSENSNGTIVKMLDAFDDFFQMHTLFKIPLFLQKVGLIDNILGISFDTKYFGDFAITHFNNSYMKPLGIKDMTGKNLSSYKTLEAGKATVIFKEATSG